MKHFALRILLTMILTIGCWEAFAGVVALFNAADDFAVIAGVMSLCCLSVGVPYLFSLIWKKEIAHVLEVIRGLSRN